MPNRRQAQRRETTHERRVREVHEETHTTPSGEKHTIRHTTEAGATVGAVGGPVGAAAGAAGGAVVGTGVKAAKAGNDIERKALTAPITAVTSHTHSGILAWGTLLLILATWQPFWIPTFAAMKDKNVQWNVTTTGKRMELGGVAFVILMAFLANSSDDMEKVMTWLLIAFWVLFIIMNGTPTIKSIFTWFGQGGTTTKKTTTTTNTDPCINLTGNARKLCEANRT